MNPIDNPIPFAIATIVGTAIGVWLAYRNLIKDLEK